MTEVQTGDHLLDTIALIRASINHDREAKDVILRHANPDHLRDWLLVLAKCWLLDACDIRNPNAAGGYEAEEQALNYLDGLTSTYREELQP